MKNIARKQKNRNVLSLVDNPKFKEKRANENLFSYTMQSNLFQFQIGDRIICREYLGEELSPNALVIAKTEYHDKAITTVANALEVSAVVVAFKREVMQ